MGKNDKITCTFYIGDKQVDRLPPEFIEDMMKRMGEAVSRYYERHPDEYVKMRTAYLKRMSEEGKNPVQT